MFMGLPLILHSFSQNTHYQEFMYRSIPAQNYVYIRWKIHLAFTLRSIIIIYQEIIVLHLSPMYR